MNIYWALLMGAFTGATVLGAAYAVVPSVPTLAEELGRLRRGEDPPPVEVGPGFSGRWVAWLGPRLRRGVESLGIDLGGLGPDLRVVGRSLDQHLGLKGVAGLVGVLLPALWCAGMALAGQVRVPAPAAIGLSVVTGLGGFFLPDMLLRSEAGARRRAFRSAFGTFLDMTTISLAGGVGVEGAIMDAARVGRGREAAVLYARLDDAMWSGESQWAAMRRLGLEMGLPELVEASSTMALAGTEGARVRRSLEAKARGLRSRDLAAAEASALAATERMAIPTALLMLGFLLLVGYPALQSVVGKV